MPERSCSNQAWTGAPMHRVELEGRIPTLNSWLSGTHWRTKHKEKKEWQDRFLLAFLEAKLPKKLSYPITLSVTMYCKSKVRDVDNAVLAGKFCADALVANGYLEDDSPKYISSMILTTHKGVLDKTVIIIQ